MVAQQVRDLVVSCVICGVHSDESVAHFGLERHGSTCRFCEIGNVFNVIDSALDFLFSSASPSGLSARKHLRGIPTNFVYASLSVSGTTEWNCTKLWTSDNIKNENL